MSWNTMKDHLKNSFQSLWRNGWMTIAAISGVAITILLVGLSLMLVFNISKVSHEIENDVSIRVSVNPKSTVKQERTLKRQLQELPGVKKITYSSKQQELKKVIGQYGRSFAMFEGDQNPLNDVYIVKATTPRATIKLANRAQKLDNVSDVTYGGNKTKSLFSVMNTIRTWSMIVAVVLLVIAVFLIANTIRITILSREHEVKIMRLVGATRWYIRWPFILEGAWTGLIGAIIPVIVINSIYSMLIKAVGPQLAASGYELLSQSALLWPLDSLLVIIAIAIGAFGAAVSMRRFLKI